MKFLVQPRRRRGYALRQVVAERGQEHVVGCLRLATGSRPSIAYDVRILRTNLDFTLRTVIGLVPETKRAFENGASITRAVRQRTRIKPAHRSAARARDLFSRAAGVLK